VTDFGADILRREKHSIKGGGVRQNREGQHEKRNEETLLHMKVAGVPKFRRAELTEKKKGKTDS